MRNYSPATRSSFEIQETFMNILITGGAGYCGSVLVPKLLRRGHHITVYDTFWFGNHLKSSHTNLKLVAADIRDVDRFSATLKSARYDCVLHLACIANDASFELDEELSTSVNYLVFPDLVEQALKNRVSRFIYASSSSVYGISSAKNVTEDHELVPLTLYNKFKGLCEPILLDSASENFTAVVFRPATVCGYSPRQRLDLTVNILTNLAFNKGEITVFGGEQLRPNLHVKDYADVCELLINCDAKLVNKQVFNVGGENLSIMQIAEIVKVLVSSISDGREIQVTRTDSADNRSYHISSDKIQRVLGFTPSHDIKDAVLDLCEAFKLNRLPNSLEDDVYFNVQRMKRLAIK